MRDGGWYRVNVGGDWYIALFNDWSNSWSFCGEITRFNDAYFDRIDDERLSAVPGSDSDAS